jgi:uncharacterized membrane-anchored protein YitT (DUF2179 family)
MKIKSYFTVTLGTMLAAFAISVFYTPNKIVSGGVSGIAIILYYITNIPTAFSIAVMNILLLLVALKKLGFAFVRDTLTGVVLFSVFIRIFSYIPPLTDNILLASIFGAICFGTGVGLTLISGASTGGTDIIARLFQSAYPHIKIGNLMLGVDSAVIVLSLVSVKDIDLMLYGISALIVASFSINMLISKLNISKLAFVITDKGEEISQLLVSASPRGVTLINATGAYTREEKDVLMCALKESETPLFQKRILEIDSNAFIIFSESQQIVGNGFRVYK